MEPQYYEPHSMKFHKFMIYCALPLRILLEAYNLIVALTSNSEAESFVLVMVSVLYASLFVLDLCAEVNLVKRSWLGVKLFSISLALQIVLNLITLMLMVQPGASVLFNLIYFGGIILVGVWLYAFRKYYEIRRDLFL